MSHLKILFFLIAILIPVALFANNVDAPLAEKKTLKNIEESSQVIKEIKSKAPFVNIQQERIWRFKDNGSKNDKEEAPMELGWLTNTIAGISIIIEFILWVIPVLIALYLYKNRKTWLALIVPRKSNENNIVLPDTLFGLDMRLDNFPDNIELFAQELWSKNKKREAISLLYRGALIFVFSKNRFTLSRGATEQDCLRYLKNYNKSKDFENEFNDKVVLNRFSLITDFWVNIAYAHILPTNEEFCKINNGWNALFRASKLNKNDE